MTYYVIVVVPEGEFIYCGGVPVVTPSFWLMVLVPPTNTRFTETLEGSSLLSSSSLACGQHPLIATGDVVSFPCSSPADVSPPFANIYLNTLMRLPKG